MPLWSGSALKKRGILFVVVGNSNRRQSLASTQDTTKADTQGDMQADVQFIEVSDGPEFRTDLHQALRDGLTALGLLGWEHKDGSLQAKNDS